MSENRFTVWHMFGLLIIAGSVAILFLGGGLFLGFQVGRSTTLATTVANRAAGTALPLSQGQQHLTNDVTTVGPYLGVEFEALTPALAKTENLAITSGALLRNVMPNSPAAKAGLQAGDVVQAVNNQPVDQTSTLRELVHQHQAGETLTLTVWRAGQVTTYSVTLTTVPTGFDFSAPTLNLTPSLQLQCYPGPCDPAPATVLP